MTTLGQEIKNARKNKGWTQERLGIEAGLGQATISALENDDFGARFESYSRTVIKVAAALDSSSILAQHCATCPIRLHLFKTHFGHFPLKNNDLTSITKHLKTQMEAAVRQLDELGKAAASGNSEREGLRQFLDQIHKFEEGIRILKYQMMIDSLR